MTSLWVKNWDKWQSYRRDRGAPPWVKVYRKLLTNPDWSMLSDAEKGQLVSLWIVAADNGGRLPGDAKMLRKICILDDIPDVEKFIELGFLTDQPPTDDVTVTPTRRHGDAPETETETEKKEEADASSPASARATPSSEPDPIPPGIPPDSWQAFEEHRRDINRPMTNLARQTIWKTLLQINEASRAPALNSAIVRGLREPCYDAKPVTGNGTANPQPRKGAITRAIEALEHAEKHDQAGTGTHAGPPPGLLPGKR